MNRKNLTAAVLAGLTGMAGIAGSVQANGAAVNMNPDGLGEVLLYPYYTTNDDNTTLVTVVNTTGDAKAVKVRFLEAYNSREVLDFNLYLSEYDVWVAAIADSSAFGAEAGVPHLFTPDTSCTVPYLYGDFYDEASGGGLVGFLDYAFTGDFEDGGPTDISRASEGYLEVIEMGVMTGKDGVTKDELAAVVGKHAARMDSKTAATHILVEDEDTGEEMSMPADCDILVENWTQYRGNVTRPHPLSGWWLDEAIDNCPGLDSDDRLEDVDPDDVGRDIVSGTIDDCGQTDGITIGSRDLYSTMTNAGGLFGGAAIINVPKGTMFSYDAKAIQGYDTTDTGLHFYPGTIHPSLNDGSTDSAVVFLGMGQQGNFSYSRPVDAISALFMHETLSNTYVIEEEIAAGTEWVMTLPTKAWYVDTLLTGEVDTYYIPDSSDPFCFDWNPRTDPNPFRIPANGGTYGDAGEDCPTGVNPRDWEPGCDFPEDYTNCTPLLVIDEDALSPFSEAFDGESCDTVVFKSWDREESPSVEGGDIVPPIVSPAPPTPPTQRGTPFELCYEVNVLRFGETSVFGTESDILYTVTGTADAGWARITMDGDLESVSGDTLVGLPITGFSAEQYTNGELEGGVLANYGGLFDHKGSVCVVDGSDEDADCSSSYTD